MKIMNLWEYSRNNFLILQITENQRREERGERREERGGMGGELGTLRPRRVPRAT